MICKEIEDRIEEIRERAAAGDSVEAFALRHDLYRDVVRQCAAASDEPEALAALLAAQAAIPAEDVKV